MFVETRLSRYLTEILYHLKTKFFTVQNAFSLVLLSLFIGFIFGNLFGTFLDTLRLYFFWNGLVGLILLVFIETVNFLVYGVSFPKIDDKKTILTKFPSVETQPNVSSLAKLGDLEQINNQMSLYSRREFLNKSPSSTRSINTMSARVPKRAKNSFFVLPLKNQWFRFVENLWKPNIICSQKNIIHIERALNSFKIGLLFGFFVDSFKVGS